MQILQGLKQVAITLSAVIFLQSLVLTDFWITPASARYYCNSVWIPQPDPDDVVWLPYRTYCPPFQTMSSNPSWWLIDDYPTEDLLNCKELNIAREKARLEEGSICVWVPVGDIPDKIVHQTPIACNGNVSSRYFVGTKVEIYDQAFDVVCPGYPTTSMEISIGTKYFVREPVGPGEPIEGKNLGAPSCGLSAGNPINIATGNKFDVQQDARLPGGLDISRYYNSSDNAIHSFGKGWRGSFERSIKTAYSNSQGDASLTVTRDDGAENYWRIENGVPKAPPDASGKLEVVYVDGGVLGFSLITKNQSIETYDANGKLLSITHEDGETLNFAYSGSRLSTVTSSTGRTLAYSYDSDGRVDQISSSSGSDWKYAYDGDGNLSQVEFPGGGVKTYHYEDQRFPNALTGVTDENGNRIRSWAFDDSGRAILSTYGDAQSDVQRHTISYEADGITSTTDPLQNTVDHTFKARHGVFKFDSASGICGGCSNSTESTTYDERGNRDRVTDFAGNITDYDYSVDNLVEKVTYAVGSPEQFEVNYTWDTDLRKPSQVIRGSKVTGFTYNSRGQILTRSETDPAGMAGRTWTYTYHETPALPSLVGKIKSVDGPRTDVADVMQYEYYASNHPGGEYRAGDLKAVINPLGHRTDYLKYDGDGRLLELSDANGVITSISYYPRGWRKSVTADGKTTQYAYDKAGNLTGSTLPDGSHISYEYDNYQRLISIEDGLGNRTEYMLDAAGNRTSERTYDDLGALRRQLGRVFNSLNQLETTIDGNNGETRFDYDGNGNRISVVDANLNMTRYEYDSLKRLVKIIDPVLGETLVTHDSSDKPLTITDPMGNTTSYFYDGLENHTGLDSPDTGSTSHEYDEAGNRIATTDARGVRTEFTFDALNRLLEISYPDNSLNVVYGYDEGPFGKGRLTSMIDAVGKVEFAYDRYGNLVSETRTADGRQFITSYTYNPADRLVQTTYPSGMVIDYLLDAAGQVTSVSKTEDAVTETLVENVLYAPFGAFTSFTYGNSSSYSSTLNLDYETEQLESGPGLEWSLGYDSLGNVVAITDQADAQKSQAFAYDQIYRLELAEGAYGSEAFSYDANGNRIRLVDESTDEIYTYQQQSNQLATQDSWTFTRAANGSRTGKQDARGLGQLYAYGDDSRLSQATLRNESGDFVLGDYRYNGRGQRAEKSTPGERIHYVYGLSGEILGEYSTNDNGPFTEYVYLNSMPVAAITHKPETTSHAGAEFILDNGDPGTSSTGAWRTVRDNHSYGGEYLLASKASNRTYRWTATPPGIDYEVYAWWVDKKNQSDSVDYTIRYGSGETDTVTKSHKTGGSHWQLLGKYHSADGQDYVEVSSRSDKFVADAIRWVEVKEPEIIWSETTNFIHFDHLGTPRRVTDQNQKVIWSWDSTPFGDSQPDQDPDGDSQEYVLNLRFPGQYYDAETGLHYNYFRTYDPSVGRYIESDPIGVRGGLNTFGYAYQRPHNSADPWGLFVTGEWLEQPRFNFRRLGLVDFDLVGVSGNLWGQLKFIRVYGYVNGFVNIDVKCKNSDDCGKPEWEVHSQIEVLYQGSTKVGINAYASAAGKVLGFYGWAAANLLATGGSTLTGGLELLQAAKQKAGAEIALIYAKGPEAICLASGGN